MAVIGVGSLVRVSLLLNFEWLDEVLVYVVAMRIDISDRVFKSKAISGRRKPGSHLLEFPQPGLLSNRFS